MISVGHIAARHIVGMPRTDPSQLLNNRVQLAIEICNQEPAWLPDLLAAFLDILEYPNYGLAFTRLSLDQTLELDKFNLNYLAKVREAQDEQLGSLPAAFVLRVNDVLRRLQPFGDFKPAAFDLFMATKCLDTVFSGLMSGHSMTYRDYYLSEYRFLLRGHQPLLRHPQLEGLLLPRTAPRARVVRSAADLFDYMVRVPLPVHCEVDHDFLDQGLSDDLHKLRVGFVPTIHQVDELDWRADPVRGVYTVELKPAVEDLIIQRTLEALDWLADREAELIILPELVSSNNLWHSIERWRARHPGAYPRLIVAGSHLCEVTAGAPALANRAHVIGEKAATLWQQNKMNPYTFTAQHQKDCGHKLCLPVQDLVEDIDRLPVVLVVRDTLQGDRIAVLICEDFARELPHHQTLVKMGVTRLFVPIMNGSRANPEDWVKRHGVLYAQEPFAVSIVANSAALVCLEPGDRVVSEDLAVIFSVKDNLLKSEVLSPNRQVISAIFMEVKV